MSLSRRRPVKTRLIGRAAADDGTYLMLTNIGGTNL
jgi:hypothetical protein